MGGHFGPPFRRLEVEHHGPPARRDDPIDRRAAEARSPARDQDGPRVEAHAAVLLRLAQPLAGLGVVRRYGFLVV